MSPQVISFLLGVSKYAGIIATILSAIPGAFVPVWVGYLGGGAAAISHWIDQNFGNNPVGHAKYMVRLANKPSA